MFADIVNNLLFHGRKRLLEEELEQGRELYTHLDRQVNWGDDLKRCEDIGKQHIRQLLALLNLTVNITDIELDQIQKFVSSKTSPYIR